MTGKRSGIIAGIIVLAGLGVLAWAAVRPGPMAFAGGKRLMLAEYPGSPTGVPADFAQTDALARARYLTEAADCEACHTADGGKPFAGGLAFQTEFGTIYSPNITPDPKTGIGTWTDADFLKAVHRGISKDKGWLYPAFPYAAYTYLTDADALAIKAYLFSLPPLSNVPPPTKLRFPYNQRRGAYLVEALGHCGDCHTPRTALQSLDNRHKFAGGLSEGWRAYNLTSDADSGIGGWSRQDLEGYLKTGHSLDRGTAFGPMAQAVHLSFQRLTATDVSAIAEYVRSVPPIPTPDLPAPKLKPASEDPAQGLAAGSNPRGEALFASLCAGCHTWTGTNRSVPHATLTGTRAVNDPTATNVALAVLRGATTLPPSGDIAIMPAFGQAWSDEDIAAVSNYVVARFGAKASAITGAEVQQLREAK